MLRDIVFKKLEDYEVDTEYSVVVKELKEGEKPSIVSDSMFKTMLFNQNRIKYACKLISYFVDIPYEELLKNLKFVKNELDKEHLDDSNQRSDFVAFIHGTYINIEMNNNSNLNYMERNYQYVDKLYGSKIKIGSSKNPNYMPVLQINFNNFALKGIDKIFDIYAMRNDEGILMNDKKIIVQIYLPNLRKKCYNEGVEKLDEREKFILTMVESSIEKATKIAKGFDLMEEYLNESEKVITDINFGESYDKELALKDLGRQEGEEIGILRGKEETQLEIAKNLLSLGTVPIEDISKTTGLDIDTLKNLK